MLPVAPASAPPPASAPAPRFSFLGLTVQLPGPHGSASWASRFSFLGLTPETHTLVLQLSSLFSLDSFAGGLVTGTLLAYFFNVTYQVRPPQPPLATRRTTLPARHHTAS